MADVPQSIQDKIDHERFIDQRERWASKTTADNFKDAVVASDALLKILTRRNVNQQTTSQENEENEYF